jgi:hypothetical protein
LPDLLFQPNEPAVTGSTIDGMNATNRTVTCLAVLITISVVAIPASAQFSTTAPAVAQETQARGYWTDPSTGLMWAARDNGKRVGWHKATRYCRNLRLAGHSDWRLPTIEELHGLVNLGAYATEHVGSKDIFHWNVDLRVNGGLLLSDDRQWSSSPVNPAVKHPSKFWFFNFREGRTREGFEDLLEGDTMNALCVRD